ncbi:MAG: PAS-domain containing protein, partial [Rhodospirillales bacterium]|nr:PAS-domain containing protein [Rhodospirillales bacterium]
MNVLEKIGSDQQLIEALPVAVAVFGENGRLCLFNQAYISLFQLDRAWLEGQPSYSDLLTHLRETQMLPEVVDFKAFRVAETARLANLKTPQTDTLYLPSGAAIRRLATPADGGFILSYEDLSARLEAERARNEFAAVQQQSLDHLSESLAVFGADGRMKFCNAAFRSLWGLEDGSDGLALPAVLDLMQAALLADGDWPEIREQLALRLLGRKSGAGRIELSDGRVLEASHIPLPDGAALLRYADITDSAHLQDALREKAQSMEIANRAKSEFMATLSHQVRTPLTTISGFAQLLSGEHVGKLNKRQGEYADGIVHQSKALSSLLAGIVELAGIEAGLSKLEIAPIDLHAALNDAFQ